MRLVLTIWMAVFLTLLVFVGMVGNEDAIRTHAVYTGAGAELKTIGIHLHQLGQWADRHKEMQ